MFNVRTLVYLILSFVFTPISANEDFIHVGYQKLSINVEETAETLSVAIVYPTNTSAKAVNFGPFRLTLAINAPIASGKFPLVIISHGSGGTNLGHRSIAFNLVKKGFIVAMPLHPKNNYKDNSAEGTDENWVNRPKHIKSTIETITSNPDFTPSVDTNKIAIIGHSAGGYTALTVAGGIANTSHLADLCKSHARNNQVFCRLGSKALNHFTPITIKTPPDDRIKAIILMAPVGVLFKSENSLNNVNASLLLLSAEKDKQLTEPHHADVISNRYTHKENLQYRTIKNAGHYSFITPFPKSISRHLGEVSKDPEGFDRELFHKLLSSEISTYLVKTLK